MGMRWVLVLLLVTAHAAQRESVLGSFVDTLKRVEQMDSAERVKLFGQAGQLLVESGTVEMIETLADTFARCMEANSIGGEGCDTRTALEQIALLLNHNKSDAGEATRTLREPQVQEFLEFDAGLITRSKALTFDYHGAVTKQSPPVVTYDEAGALIGLAVVFFMQLGSPSESPFIQEISAAERWAHKRGGHIFSLLKAKPVPPQRQECKDNIILRDTKGRACTYYNDKPEDCGKFDGKGFMAVYMCCACKVEQDDMGANRGDLNELMAKWAIIRTSLTNFDQWRTVWSKPGNGLHKFGGLNQICKDWLPFIHRQYDEGKPIEQWECKGAQDSSAIGDIFNLFSFARLEDIPIGKLGDKYAAEGKSAAVQSMEADLIKSLPTLDECSADRGSQECKQKIRQQRDLARSLISNSGLNGLQAMTLSEEIRDYVFSVWNDRDEVFGHFCQPGPVSRLQYVFEQAGVDHDSHMGEYQLPDEDLHMCWKIMEAAVDTRPKRSWHQFDTIRNIIKGTLYWMLIVRILSVIWIYISRLNSTSGFLQCPNVQRLVDSQSMKRIVCSASNVVGSLCIAQCRHGYGEQSDGHVRALHTRCGTDGTWDNPSFKSVCLPVSAQSSLADERFFS